MVSNNCIPAFFHIKKGRFALLILCWLIGAILGIWIFQLQRVCFVSLMRGAFGSAVSIVGLLSVIILPLSITAFAIIYSKPLILHILCLAKSALYSLCVCAIYFIYGSAGWLAQGLLLFLDNCSIILLWTLWCSSDSLHKRRMLKIFASCFVLCIGIWLFDYFAVSQFAVLVLC